MTPLYGHTRTYVGARHALITPDGHVASTIPGLEQARCVAHITPAVGAKFVQLSVTMEAGKIGSLGGDGEECFLYVLEGQLKLHLAGEERDLVPGMYLYLAPGTVARLEAGSLAKWLLFQKPYVGLKGQAAPESFVGNQAKIAGAPFLGNAKALLQVLLPLDLSFDLAVNIFTYQPGATLPFVETHVMEHGLLMLSGQGIYRLEDKWYPVIAGDVIWMAPYCPQWFVAMGDEPASYLYYKDVNRPLL